MKTKLSDLKNRRLCGRTNSDSVCSLCLITSAAAWN